MSQSYELQTVLQTLCKRTANTSQRFGFQLTDNGAGNGYG
jgi:hypothetical protein